MEILTLSQRRQAAEALLRIKPDSMTGPELDLAIALLCHKQIDVDAVPPQQPPRVLTDHEWGPYSPTTDWRLTGELLSNVGLVSGSHAIYGEGAESETVVKHWYSCHAYVGGTSTEGYDLQTVVGITAAKLLAHEVEFSPAWKA
ncbi:MULTISPECIES: hypothetical protein [unclassified Variovorax]|uniref:hypothetical protein n=1 Tax=unclassified Variovorax TaxID=663243 RepID=UPI0013184F3C|nr:MULTISPECIES: hypothetical protein [unclassified Variovorax]VTU42118.1 hypothetical protein SRS16P1_00196 [Variovorax sp. SRS16]VTU42152.1 hypothetical protein E5P1_00194 [Variovorax sp. PBL-E5]VTU44349.1 hypothetical protein H6P1_00737 [Variovorax sp. PBL-H6]